MGLRIIVLVSLLSLNSFSEEPKSHLSKLPRIAENLNSAASDATSRNRDLVDYYQMVGSGKYEKIHMTPRLIIKDPVADFVDFSAFSARENDPFSNVILHVIGDQLAKGLIQTPEQVDEMYRRWRNYGEDLGYGRGDDPNYASPLAGFIKDFFKDKFWSLDKKLEYSKLAFDAGSAIGRQEGNTLSSREIERDLGKIDLLKKEVVKDGIPKDIALWLATLAHGEERLSNDRDSLLAAYILSLVWGPINNEGEYKNPSYKYATTHNRWEREKRLRQTAHQSADEIRRVGELEKQVQSERRKAEDGAKRREEALTAVQMKNQFVRLDEIVKQFPSLAPAVNLFKKRANELKSLGEDPRASSREMSEAQFDFEQAQMALGQAIVDVAQKNPGDDQKLRDLSQAVDAGVQLANSISRLIGFKDPEVAHHISNAVNFAGGVTLGIIAILGTNPVTGSFMIANALVNFIGGLLGGGSSTAQILQEIKVVQDMIKNLQERMDRQFENTNELIQTQLHRQFSVMLEEIDRLETSLKSEIREVRDLERQTHGRLDRIGRDQYNTQAMLMAIAERFQLAPVEKALSVLINDEGKVGAAFAADNKNAALEFRNLMTDIELCASQKVYQTLTPPVDATALKTQAKEKAEFFASLPDGLLATGKFQSGLEKLPVLNEVYKSLGSPLWKEGDVAKRLFPNAALWAYCMDAYLRVANSPDPRTKELFDGHLAWKEEGGQKGRHIEKMMEPGRAAKQVLSDLRRNPEPIKKAFEQAKGYVRGLEEEVLGRLVKKFPGAPNEKGQSIYTYVHAGPFQNPHQRPEYRSGAANHQGIYPCAESEEKLKAEGIDSRLNHHIPFPSGTVESLNALVPPVYQNAESVGLGKVEICLSNVEWNRHRNKDVYKFHYGTLFDWQQYRHGNLDYTFKVQFRPSGEGKPEVIDEFTWRSKKVEFYDWRTFFWSPEHLAGKNAAKYARSKKKEELARQAESPDVPGGRPREGRNIANWWKDRMADQRWDERAVMTHLFTDALNGEGTAVFDRIKPQRSGRAGHNTVFHDQYVLPGTAFQKPAHTEGMAEALAEHLKGKKYESPENFLFEGVDISKASDELRKSVAAAQAIWKEELINFFPRLSIYSYEKELLEGNALAKRVEQTYREMRKRIANQLNTLLAAQQKNPADAALIKALKAKALEKTDAIYKSQLALKRRRSPEGKIIADSLPFNVEIRHRIATAQFEPEIASAILNRDGDAELRINTPLAAYDGLIETLRVTGDVMGIAPVKTPDLFVAPRTPQEARQIIEKAPPGLVTSKWFQSATRGALPLYSVSERDVFDQWKENLDRTESEFVLELMSKKLRTNELFDKLLEAGSKLERDRKSK